MRFPEKSYFYTGSHFKPFINQLFSVRGTDYGVHACTCCTVRKGRGVGGDYGVHACTCCTARKGPESGEGRKLTKQ